MIDVTYELNSDRPTSGVLRVDCMSEILKEETERDFAQIPVDEAYEYISALCLLINALPPSRPFMKTAWIKLIASRLAAVHRQLDYKDIVGGLAQRLLEEREAWEKQKRTHYGELTA